MLVATWLLMPQIEPEIATEEQEPPPQEPLPQEPPPPKLTDE